MTRLRLVVAFLAALAVPAFANEGDEYWKGADAIASGSTAITGGTDNQVLVNESGVITGDNGLLFDGNTDILSGPAAVRTGDGSAAATAFGFGDEVNTGVFQRAANTLGFVVAGTQYAEVDSARLSIHPSSAFAWKSTSAFSSTPDLFLLRDAANVLAVRNGTAAQKFSLYETYTDSTANFERGEILMGSDTMEIGPATAGTGVDNMHLNLKTAGTGDLKINGTAGVSATYTIRDGGGLTDCTVTVTKGIVTASTC